MSEKKKKKMINFKELPLKQKIMWIVVLLLLICILSFFGYIIYKSIMDKRGYPIQNITNENLKDEHCYEDVCVKDVVINYEKNDISSIYGVMYHKGAEVKDTCFKIKFARFGTTETYDFNICYFGLEPYKELDFATYFDEDQADLVYSRSFELTGISEEEFNELYQLYLEESE